MMQRQNGHFARVVSETLTLRSIAYQNLTDNESVASGCARIYFRG